MMGKLHAHQIGLAAERYMRRYCRDSNGPVDARRLANSICERVPSEEARALSRDQVLSLVIDRASRQGHAVRW